MQSPMHRQIHTHPKLAEIKQELQDYIPERELARNDNVINRIFVEMQAICGINYVTTANLLEVYVTAIAFQADDSDDVLSYIRNIIRNQFAITTNTDEYELENKVSLNVNIDFYRWLNESKTPIECSVCQDSIKVNQYMFKLPCDHCFHANKTECCETTIEKWFLTNSTCPNCRFNVADHEAEFIL